MKIFAHTKNSKLLLVQVFICFLAIFPCFSFAQNSGMEKEELQKIIEGKTFWFHPNSNVFSRCRRIEFYGIGQKLSFDFKSNLKFNFESLNKLFPLKVVFESVPFIDIELKRGWSKSIKDYLYNNLVSYVKENNSENLSLSKIEETINCLLGQLTKDYTLKEFQLLAEYEKGNYFNKTIKTCN